MPIEIVFLSTNKSFWDKSIFFSGFFSLGIVVCLKRLLFPIWTVSQHPESDGG
jgi:hypothetical protein